MTPEICNAIIIIYGLTLCALGDFYKHMSFGWGLGDLIGYAIMHTSLLVHIGLVLFSLSSHDHWWIYVCIFGGIWIFISLKATVFRGNEYKWNGKLFYEHGASRLKQIKKHN